MEISVAMWKKFLPIFVRIVVEREDVVGVPYIDDEASGDKTEVLLHHDQVLTPSGQTTVFFDEIGYNVQSFAV